MNEIVCLDTFIKTMKKIQEVPNLDVMVEKDTEINLLCGSSQAFINNAQDELTEDVLNIELSAGYYLFDDFGLPLPTAVKKLNQNGFSIIKLGEVYRPFHYGVKSDKSSICVLVSCM